ncbi:MAG: hypothetical protein ACRDJI_10865 [Actinomycetota bacterium]
MKVQAAWAEFRGDLGATLNAWAKAPALPLVSLVLGLIPALGTGSGWFVLLYFLFCVALVGWYGTERIWYLRVFRGKRMAPSELVRFSGAFIMPFFLLGLISSLVAVPLTVLAVFASSGDYSGWIHYVFVYIPLDVLLTFMTPALAFSTRSPFEAFSVGINMLIKEWPRCIWYALAPPLAALVAIQTIPAIGSRVALTAAATLLNLWFKGATAAYYLRRHEVGDNGSLTVPEVLRAVESGAEDL